MCVWHQGRSESHRRWPVWRTRDETCCGAITTEAWPEEVTAVILGWLWSSIGWIAVLLLISLVFLQRLHRSRREIQALNADLEQQVRVRTAELRQQASYQHALIDNLPVAVWLKDAERRYLTLNASHNLFTGHGDVELIGRVDEELWPGPIGEKLREADLEVMATRQPLSLEMIIPDIGGLPLWREIDMAPVIDDDGSLLGTVGVSRDISERKEAEGKLKQALEEARRLARSRSEFLANMSHDLRSPLNSILGYTQILGQDRKLDEAYRSKVSVIQESGEQLLMMLNDVLDFAKSESDRIELYKSDVPTAFFLQTIAGIVRAEAEAKGIEFITGLAPDLPEYIHVDEKRLHQVLINLLSNAVKFTEQGEVKLEVDFVAPQTLRICVRDTGIGIVPDRLETIFQPLEQDTDKRYRLAGIGMGLSISRELIRLMGGEIRVESTPGQGSLFRFEIEVGIGTPEDEVFDSERAICGYLGEPKTLLVVDELPENRTLVRDMLTPFGFRILEAVDGQDGLEKTNSERPDLVLMDINMRYVDDLESLRRLRKMPELGTIPIIVMSASVSNEDQAACMAAGADAFLASPLHLQRTLWQIGVLLRLKWEYESAEQDSGEKKAELVPEVQELKAFVGLAEIGDMHGIIKRIDHLLEIEPGYGGFCQRLRSLATSYQAKAVLTFVRQYIEGESG
ncbi:MAG: ATP-binding protein [Candidatus Thiodiazotropha sp.]